MAPDAPNSLDQLFEEYSAVFQDFDDLTLARWMSQTLGQLHGRATRLSHPLVAAYRLAAQVSHDRSIWLKRLVSMPSMFAESACCRSPLLPLLTRDVCESGLVCLHCNETAIPFADLPEEARPVVKGWGEEYAPLHAIAHWDEQRQAGAADYERAFEDAASRVETLLAFGGKRVAASLLDVFPAVVWEDQDECLEVRPEDVRL